MKRRDFLRTSAGLTGAMIPALGEAQGQPCPPSRIGVAGGTTATAACAPAGSAADWLTRSTGAGVVAAFNGTDANRIDGNRTLGRIAKGPAATGNIVMGMWNGTRDAAMYAFDTSVKASGDYSIRLDSLQDVGEASMGPFISLDNYADQFGENSDLWVQWRQRFNSTMVNEAFLQTPGYGGNYGRYISPTSFWVGGNYADSTSWKPGYLACAKGQVNGAMAIGTVASSTYDAGTNKTNVVCSWTTGALTSGQDYDVYPCDGVTHTAWKQFIFCSGLLDVYPEDGLPPPVVYPPTLSNYEFRKNTIAAGIAHCDESQVVANKKQRDGGLAYPESYHSCTAPGQYAGWQDTLANGYISHQNKGVEGGPWTCQYWPLGNTNTSGCTYYVPDEWMTFKVHLRLGPLGTAVSSHLSGVSLKGYTNSTYELYYGRQGQPVPLQFRKTGLVVKRGNNTDQLGSYHRARFGFFFFTNFMTRKWPGQRHATGSTWFDEIIVSRNDIPDPSV